MERFNLPWYMKIEGHNVLLLDKWENRIVMWYNDMPNLELLNFIMQACNEYFNLKEIEYQYQDNQD